jgi:DNA primase
VALEAQASTDRPSPPSQKQLDRIPSGFLKELVENTDVVDVVSKYVQLKKNGQNHHGLCPFHSENSPSFTVSETKQFYHCFGCGKHGDAIKFLQEHCGMTFIDAVKDLCSMNGMRIPESSEFKGHQANSQKVNPVLYEMMYEASKYYQWCLLQNIDALKYVVGRGISALTAVRFGIGYAPVGWQNLEEVYANYKSVELELCGLVTKSENKTHYDRFRDRIMVPILNSNGDVIGFGGRVLGDGDPKYLNSPETALFDKGSEVFGIPQATEAMRSTGVVIVVEGFMDTMAVSEHGIRNVVATMGTATTSNHTKKLFRMCDRIIYCFDGDLAGLKAAWKAMESTIQHLTDSKSASFVFLPEGEDPDSFIRRNGKSAFIEKLDKAMPLSDYLIRRLIARCKPESAEGKAKMIFEAKPIMAKFRLGQAKLLRLQMLKQLSSATDFTVQELDELCPGDPN